MPLSAEERQRLLETARAAIAARLAGGAPEVPEAAGRLGERSGVFVTLRRREDGELRGCVGLVEPRLSLAEGVVHAALAAAFDDGRFEPVRASELGGLALDVSVLSPLQPIAPEDVEVGVHGLLIRYGSRSGLLLPLVPLQYGWDREQFLDYTCRKAGLPPGTWKKPEAELLAFTAECFGEE